MTLHATTAYVQQVKETEQQLIQAAKAAIATESGSKWKIGQLAQEWTQQYAKGKTDAEFAELVGGLTRSQVQQRRQVFEKYSDVCHTYGKLSWSHFYVAVDWSDAEEWLAEADKHGWSVATMKSQREEATVGAEAVDSTADVTFVADACGSVEDSNRLPHSGTADVPNAAPPSKRVEKAKGAGRESRPQEPERSQAELLVDQADSVARITIPGIIEAGKSFDEFLIQHERSGIDTERVLALTKELNEIFFTAKREISKCK